MHPHAKTLIADAPPALQKTLEIFFDAYDAMDRENAFLRLQRQAGGCPYGHTNPATGVCQLGYPGCACMDDVLALSIWSPEDEGTALARVGQRLRATEHALDGLRQAATGVALTLDAQGRQDVAQALRDAVAGARPKVDA